VPQRQAAGDVGVEAAPAVDDGVIDRLEGGEAVADLGHMGPGLGGVVVHAGKHPHPAISSGPGHGGVGAQRWLGAAGMIVPSWGCGRRRPRIRWGANSPSRLSRRSTRLPLTCTPCSRRSRARTLR
jgi:hypothetical protein